jgi:molecular chaperone HscB
MKKDVAVVGKVSMSDNAARQISLSCWDCGSELGDESLLFCPQCKTLQPPRAVDYFTRLGFEVDYNIGGHALERAYFDLQRLLHPDRFAAKSDKEKRYSMEQTMAVNEAYQALNKPLSRAEHLLSLHGIIVMGDKATIKPDHALLVESMEVRERLSTLSDEKDLRVMEVHAAEERVKVIETIRNAFQEEDLALASQQTIRLRYLEKLIEEIKAK